MTVAAPHYGRCSAVLLDPAAPPSGFDAEWDDLAREASEPNSFYERWFVEASVQHLHTPSDLKLLVVRAATGALIGLLPLHVGARYGRTPFKTVENWLHYNQFLGVPLVRARREAEFWAAVLQGVDTLWTGPDIFYLTHMPSGSAVSQALLKTCSGLRRPNAVVHRTRRAILQAGDSPDDYWAKSVRKKKRKEISRLENRLAELGEVTAERLCTAEGAEVWIAQFLALEASGWKANGGAALANDAATRAFFEQAVGDGLRAGRVELLQMRVGDHVIAMLVNFIAGAGAFSFKIAYDEDYARYSPGILIEKANLQRLSDPGFGWMDSCAVEDHPMINSLWPDRREIVRIALPRKGVRSSLIFAAVRFAERGWSAFKNFRASGQNDNRSRDNDEQL